MIVKFFKGFQQFCFFLLLLLLLVSYDVHLAQAI